MKVISFIENPRIIKKILKYLNLWEEESSQDPPFKPEILNEIVYVPIEDIMWDCYENRGFTG